MNSLTKLITLIIVSMCLGVSLCSYFMDKAWERRLNNYAVMSELEHHRQNQFYLTLLQQDRAPCLQYFLSQQSQLSKQRMTDLQLLVVEGKLDTLIFQSAQAQAEKRKITSTAEHEYDQYCISLSTQTPPSNSKVPVMEVPQENMTHMTK